MRDLKGVFSYTGDMKRFLLHSETGSLGERLAKRYIEGLGHKVLAQNYYFEKGKRSGEIDLISSFQGALHFIEVKTRLLEPDSEKSRALYFPIESQVTRDKMRKCVKTAEHYLRISGKQESEYHFDVVTILYYKKEKKAEIQYLADIFF